MTPGPGRWRGRRPGTLTRGARCFLLCTARHPPPALCPLQVPRAGGTGVLAPLSEVGRPAGGAAVAALCVGGTPGEGAHSVTGGCPTAARAQGAGLGGCRARGGGQLGITPRPPRGAPAAGRRRCPQAPELTHAAAPRAGLCELTRNHQLRRRRRAGGALGSRGDIVVLDLAPKPPSPAAMHVRPVGVAHVTFSVTSAAGRGSAHEGHGHEGPREVWGQAPN